MGMRIVVEEEEELGKSERSSRGEEGGRNKSEK
jgi:hypothetical protein